MNQSTEHGKCGKCDKAHTSEAEKLEHAKTCGTKETVTSSAGVVSNVPAAAVHTK